MKLAVFFPGIGYHCDKPLLYYSRKLVQEYGYEKIVTLNYTYDGKNLRGNEEKMRQAFDSLYIQAENSLKEIAFDQYEQILFISKSIGTIIASAYAEAQRISLIACSKALSCKVRLVIWQMPNGKKKLFFSTDTSLSGEEVLLYYRTRFQIEFCFRDAKGYTGLMDCQARDKWKLDFAFNASFTSLNVAKVTMKEMGMEYSMSDSTL